jgi:hypothetical protein
MNIGTTLLAALIPIGIDLATGKGPGQQGTKGDIGKSLADSFLQSSGLTKAKDGQATGQVFTPATPTQPRSVAELTRGSPQSAVAKMSAAAQLIQNNPKLATRVPDYINGTSNPQMMDFRAKYGTSATIAQGRKTLSTPQPGKIQVRK